LEPTILKLNQLCREFGGGIPDTSTAPIKHIVFYV